MRATTFSLQVLALTHVVNGAAITRDESDSENTETPMISSMAAPVLEKLGIRANLTVHREEYLAGLHEFVNLARDIVAKAPETFQIISSPSGQDTPATLPSFSSELDHFYAPDLIGVEGGTDVTAEQLRAIVDNTEWVFTAAAVAGDRSLDGLEEREGCDCKCQCFTKCTTLIWMPTFYVICMAVCGTSAC